jgi:hypothetical protein
MLFFTTVDDVLNKIRHNIKTLYKLEQALHEKSADFAARANYWDQRAFEASDEAQRASALATKFNDYLA